MAHRNDHVLALDQVFDVLLELVLDDLGAPRRRELLLHRRQLFAHDLQQARAGPQDLQPFGDLPDDVVENVDYDEELSVVVVRTKRKTNYEKKLKKKVQTSGCAQGTVFGDLMEALEGVSLPNTELRTSWLYALTHKINTTPSLYLEAGAIHGCVLAHEDKPLVYMEDVGRHNAVDKIAGWMFKEKVSPSDKIFYTTGRLTSEMVIKTVRMGIPILISRSGFTAWGVELARKANLTLIGRARGKRFVALAGEDRIVFDQDLASVEEESSKHRRKAAVDD